MANTVRIIPESGSITFASNIATPSSSLGVTQINTQIESNGTFSIISGSQTLLNIDPSNSSLSVNNNTLFKI